MPQMLPRLGLAGIGSARLGLSKIGQESVCTVPHARGVLGT
jgi:hypothetical protein